ncbi:hypothetical protein FF1_046808 [Malus domestica]
MTPPAKIFHVLGVAIDRAIRISGSVSAADQIILKCAPMLLTAPELILYVKGERSTVLLVEDADASKKLGIRPGFFNSSMCHRPCSIVRSKDSSTLRRAAVVALMSDPRKYSDSLN